MFRVIRATLLVALLSVPACDRSPRRSGFIVVRADRTISGRSAYPLALDPSRVGTYPSDMKSGAGYFYDEVLEYRVWFNPEKGAASLNGKNDYCVAFAQYEQAQAFSQTTRGAEEPLVLVLQREWIGEPEHGHFVPEKGERITEWQVKWLPGNKRRAGSIKEFMEHPTEAGP